MKLIITMILTLFAVFSIFAQISSPAASPTAQEDDQPIKVNTLLVNIPVIVGDRDGRYIAGMTKDNFSIIQDGEKQTIEFFADENAPMNVAILIDTSGSTAFVLGGIKDAAHNFLKTFRPGDQGIILSFDYQTTTLCELTSDVKKLNKGVDRAGIAIRGGSNMQDAIYQIVTKTFASVKGRKALIVLTDGGVVGREISNHKLLNTLAEADVMVYPIIFNAGLTFRQDFPMPKSLTLPNGKIISGEEIHRRMSESINKQWEFMNWLGSVSGGTLYQNDSMNFKKSFQQIADELKKQYVIGFYPQNLDDGKMHKVAVEVNAKSAVIRTKRAIILKNSQ